MSGHENPIHEIKSGAVEASRINRELLEKTLRADGWTFNAVDFILEAVREKESRS